MPSAGAANNASKIVTTRVIKALFHPDIFRPIINMKSRAMGITEISAAIDS